VDFRRKLDRLKPPPAPVAPAGPAPAALDALRRQMSEILGRPPEPAAAPVARDLGELPFVREERSLGAIHRRVVPLAPSHHVGRIPVDSAGIARPEVLSLLALDPKLSTADPRRALYLDTETTGLGGAGTIAFLVGFAYFEDGGLVVEQLLLGDPSEEPPLLDVVGERIRAASLIVTFNGKAFDWPTLQGRRVMSRLGPLPERPHLDLLHVARRLHRARLGACSLKGLESEVLGFVRDADIDGGDVAPRYGHYLRTGDASCLVPVVEHNLWDVISMAALVGLYGEPLSVLHAEDLVGLARTYVRAGALDDADRAARAAVEGGAPGGLYVSGEIGKARGDRARALSDFEAFAAAADDPRVRLELAKLYEHFVKQPEKALEVAQRGTGERPEASERRRRRLERKVEARRRTR